MISWHWIASLEVKPTNSDEDILVRAPTNWSARLAMSKFAVIISLLG
jgi:hypothetical protein